MQVFLDDLVVYRRRLDHLDHLRLCLEKTRMTQLGLNPEKCAFCARSGTFLNHIVSQDGISVNSDKL